MAVNPGNYTPDNWSSGYRIRTVDSADTRAELFNDFSYYMVRRFEIELDTRHNNDMNIINLVNAATNNINAHAGYINNLDKTTQGINSTLNLHGGYINNIDRTTQGLNSSLEAHAGYIKNLDLLTRKHVTELVGQSNRILANQVRLNGIDSAMKLYDGYFKSLTNKDLAIDLVLKEYDGYFKNLETKTKSTDLKVSENSLYIKNLDDLTKTHTTDLVGQSNRILANQVRLNAHDALLLLNDGYIKNLELRADTTDLSFIALDGYIKNLTSRDSGFDKQFVDFDGYVKNLTTRADSADSKLIEYDGYINSLDSLAKTNQSNISALSLSAGEADRNLQSQISAMSLAESASDLMIYNKLSDLKKENGENLTFINGTLKGLKNYDDTSLKNKIDDNFTNSFKSTNYESGIRSGDGTFTKVIKGQFSSLIAELNRQLTLSFTATTNNIDSFKTYLREEFALLNDWHSLQVDWSTMINENILVAIAALDKIVAKPNGDVNVSVPAFDFDRLKEILDELSFGNVVNEAGTNLWDVLKELIETLGGVVEAVVGIVPDLIDKLIGLVIPENRNIFSEKMSQFTGKFETKFSSITSVTTEFKNVYSQPKNINSIQINIFDQNLKLIPDMFAENFSWLRSMLSAFMYLSTLVTCYKRIVGSGDVIE